MTAAQCGIAWLIGALVAIAQFDNYYVYDAAGASAAHPAGYAPMMEFFGVTICALALWWTAGRRHHELRGEASPARAASD